MATDNEAVTACHSRCAAMEPWQGGILSPFARESELIESRTSVGTE
jgi:hypothetical protein